jgi:hypothetical protein
VRGSALVRGSRAIMVMFAATFLVNVLTLLLGTVALRVVQPHIDDVRTAQRGYVIACGVAALGVVGLASAPEKTSSSAAVLLAAGALPLTRTIGTIRVNRQTGSDVRATVHSFLAQGSALGEIVCGLTIAAVARLADLPLALVTCSALLTITVLLIQRHGTPRAAPVP